MCICIYTYEISYVSVLVVGYFEICCDKFSRLSKSIAQPTYFVKETLFVAVVVGVVLAQSIQYGLTSSLSENDETALIHRKVSCTRNYFTTCRNSKLQTRCSAEFRERSLGDIPTERLERRKVFFSKNICCRCSLMRRNASKTSVSPGSSGCFCKGTVSQWSHCQIERLMRVGIWNKK